MATNRGASAQHVSAEGVTTARQGERRSACRVKRRRDGAQGCSVRYAKVATRRRAKARHVSAGSVQRDEAQGAACVVRKWQRDGALERSPCQRRRSRRGDVYWPAAVAVRRIRGTAVPFARIAVDRQKLQFASAAAVFGRCRSQRRRSTYVAQVVRRERSELVWPGQRGAYECGAVALE